MLTNLSYTPQVGWYVRNIQTGSTYSREEFIGLLCKFGLSENSAPKTLTGWKRLLIMFESVGLGSVISNGKTTTGFIRSSWKNPDPIVILYGLYKFAEACDGYYQFPFDRLFDNASETSGMSPSLIFGLSEEVLSPIIGGLAVNYPDLISFSQTHGVRTIDLKKCKTSTDVLNLL